MAYTNTEARGQLLADLAGAADQLALALACLGTAYEQLDQQRADELEQQLFHPVQLAYGRAQRTHTEFARRYGLPPRTFPAASAGLESQGPITLIERAGDAAGDADQAIAELQDSMLPVEVGDPELRAGLAGVRELVSHVPSRAHDLVRSVGR
ncbi:MAG: hypothetical protein ABSG43_14115 [Solirubrobacteraceae bacterium]|jgi:hypothetical protein